MREGREVKTEKATGNVDERLKIRRGWGVGSMLRRSGEKDGGIVGRKGRRGICPPSGRSVVLTGP